MTWILEWLALYKANSILITFIRKSVGLWNTTQETKSKAITQVAIKCRIYQSVPAAVLHRPQPSKPAHH